MGLDYDLSNFSPAVPLENPALSVPTDVDTTLSSLLALLPSDSVDQATRQQLSLGLPLEFATHWHVLENNGIPGSELHLPSPMPFTDHPATAGSTGPSTSRPQGISNANFINFPLMPGRRDVSLKDKRSLGVCAFTSILFCFKL